MKYKITYTGDRAGKKSSEVIEANQIADRGREEQWIDFYGSGDVLVLRVRARDVERVESVRDEHEPGQTETPDLSRILA